MNLRAHGDAARATMIRGLTSMRTFCNHHAVDGTISDVGQIPFA
jgi:hypothetical protein